MGDRLLEPGPPWIKRRYTVNVHRTLQVFDAVLHSIVVDCVFGLPLDPPFRLRTVMVGHEIDADTMLLFTALFEDVGVPAIDREFRWQVSEERHGRRLNYLIPTMQWDGDAKPFAFQELET